MADLAPPSTDEALAPHEADSVETVARLHRAHDSESTRLQRGIDWVTDNLGRPGVALASILVFAVWIAVTAWGSGGLLDDAMAIWLELSATIAALLIAMLILATQRRSDQLAERRAELTLQLAILSDAKNAKIIELLCELRQAASVGDGRGDAETDEMATPVDPKAVLTAIDAGVEDKDADL